MTMCAVHAVFARSSENCFVLCRRCVCAVVWSLCVRKLSLFISLFLSLSLSLAVAPTRVVALNLFAAVLNVSPLTRGKASSGALISLFSEILSALYCTEMSTCQCRHTLSLLPIDIKLYSSPLPPSSSKCRLSTAIRCVRTFVLVQDAQLPGGCADCLPACLPACLCARLAACPAADGAAAAWLRPGCCLAAAWLLLVLLAACCWCCLPAWLPLASCCSSLVFHSIADGSKEVCDFPVLHFVFTSWSSKHL